LKKAREHLTGELAPGKVLTEPPLGRAGLAAPAPVQTTLISFRDGSYKKVRALSWKHSQWIHFTLPDGSTVAANPANVNYLHIGCGD
jgi:hypothetical protein